MSEQPYIAKAISKKQAFLLYVLKTYNIKINYDSVMNIDEDYDEDTIHKECIAHFKNKTNKVKTQIVNVYNNPIYAIMNTNTPIHIL